MKKYFSLLLIFILLFVNITPLQGISLGAPSRVTDIYSIPPQANWAVTDYDLGFYYSVEYPYLHSFAQEASQIPINANWAVANNPDENNIYYYSDGESIDYTNSSDKIPYTAKWAVEYIQGINYPNIQYCYSATNSVTCVNDINTIPVEANWVTTKNIESSNTFYNSLTNMPPTSQDSSVIVLENHINQMDNIYTFLPSDFPYYDREQDQFDHIRYKGAPTGGILFYDSNSNDRLDVGEEIDGDGSGSLARESIERGKLKYIATTSQDQSFSFEVHDGMSYSLESYTMTLVVDRKPTAVFSTDATNPTNANPIPITITFSEPVTGLEVHDFTVTNGEVNSVSGSYPDYTIELTPYTEGLVMITFKENAVVDNMGNGNKATEPFTILYDSTPPVVEGVTNGSIYSKERTIIFTEGVASLNGMEIQTNTVVSQEGSHTLIVTDDAGNSTTVNFTIDRTAPIFSYTKNPSTWTNDNVMVNVYMNEFGELKWAQGSHDESYMNTHGEQITNGAFIATENGTYTILAKDIAGNTTVTEIEVSNIDRDQPVITLNGDQTIQIEKGQAYTELGYAVTDETEGDLTESVTINGNVDTSTIGIYTVTYSVTDTAGNHTEVSRIIEVMPTKVTLTDRSAQSPSIDVRDAEPNATLYLMNEAYEQVATGTANENGEYTFDAIEFDTNYYVVQEVNQLQSAPSNMIAVPASSNNSLANLESSVGTLSPNFDSDVLDYELVVDNAITTISLVPTTANEQASVKINGTTVASGDTSENIPLNVGDNVLTIEVTAGDQSTKTYTVHVKRLSNNADLSNIELSVGALNETFTSDGTNYTAILADEANQVTITATKSDTLADVKIQSKSSNSSTVDLVEGDNVVEIEVTAEDGTTKMYTVNIQYVKNIYSMHFETNGGISMNAMPVQYGASLNILPLPIKVGYTFEAWYLDEALTEPLQQTTMPSENLTLYAKWNMNEYEVIFQDALGMEIDSQVVQHGKAATAPQPPIRIGYTFTGWDQDFSEVTGNLIVSPIYEINQYKVVFQDYDGTELARELVPYGIDATAPIHPTRIGYTFIDWDKTFQSVAKDLQITAQYQINQYEITFNSNDGSSVEKIVADYNTALDKPANPIREGYTFQGWYTDEALTQAFNWENATMPAENSKLYANWEWNEYEVTFLDGEGAVWHTTMVKHGNQATVPTNPTKDGCLFTGWDVDFSSITSPLTVKAQFAKKIDAVKPEVEMKSTSNQVFQGNTSPTISVQATVADKGRLSYQWYQAISPTEAGQKIAGATTNKYAVPTDIVGTYYYYVIVTNKNAEATGMQTASSTSERMKVDIKAKSSNALLTNLTIGDELALSHAFEQNLYDYKMYISPSIENVKLTPTVMDAYATVEVNGQTGTTGKQMIVNADTESIVVTVTAQDSTKKQYMIKLIRLVPEKKADIIVNDTSVEVNTEDIEVLDQNGVLVVNLTNKSENVLLNEEQLELLRRKQAIIQSKKKDAALSIPSRNFVGEGPLQILMNHIDDKNLKMQEAKERAVGSIYKFIIMQGDKVISTFGEPIEIAFPIDSTIQNPEELKIYYFNEETEKWELVGGEYRNGNIVTRTNHFSIFGVFHPDEILVLNGEQQIGEEQPIEEQEKPMNEQQTPIIEKEESKNEQTNQQELPNTTTNTYNLLLIGILLLIAGITIRRMKHQHN